MKVSKTQRGFEVIDHPDYREGADDRLVQQSSAVDMETPDGIDRPGSSFLWLGNKHHLNRDEVRQLAAHLQAWVNTGSLVVAPPAAGEGKVSRG